MTKRSELRGAKWKATYWKNKYDKLKESIRPHRILVKPFRRIK